MVTVLKDDKGTAGVSLARVLSSFWKPSTDHAVKDWIGTFIGPKNQKIKYTIYRFNLEINNCSIKWQVCLIKNHLNDQNVSRLTYRPRKNLHITIFIGDNGNFNLVEFVGQESSILL